MAGLAHEEDTINDFTSQISGKVGSPIATGSFGEVYQCTVETSIGEMKVAVKVFRVDPRTMEKLKTVVLRELRVWLRLKHPTIVPLLGTAQVDSPLPALVSPWMSCGKLATYIDEHTTTTPSDRIKLVRGIAEGLNYLHSRDVIHGDLHPGNVLIDGSGNPCLTDFGLATVAEDPELQWTTATASMGRCFDCRWRAPEVIGIDVDPVRPTFESDIYSFGSVVFFVISGDIPWKDKRHSHQICIEMWKRITPARPYNVSRYSWDLIQECWSWDPVDRPDAIRVLHRVQVIAEYSPDRSTSYDPLQITLGGWVDPNRQYQQDTVSEVRASISPKNIVLFGGIGAGKSSVVNLIAGEKRATTSSSGERCIMHWEKHLIAFNGYDYNVFDIVGFEEPRLETKDYIDFIVNTYNLIAKLHSEGGVNLLLFCMRAGRITAAIQANYRLFYEWLCEKKVPVVLVLTGLENEPNMEKWWANNGEIFDQCGIHVIDHACITAANALPGERHQWLYEESRHLVRDLVMQHTHGRRGDAYMGGEGWFRSVMQKVRELTGGNVKFVPKKKDIEAILIKRGRMPPKAVKELASRIRSDLAGKSLTWLPY